MESAFTLRQNENTEDKEFQEIQRIGNLLQSESNKNKDDPICFNNPAWSDIKLQVNKDTKVYYAHKAILVSKSDYFKTLIMSSVEWKDSQAGTIQLHIEQTQVDLFEDFLRFLYGGHVNLRKNAIWPLYFLADFYVVPDLKHLLAKFVCRLALVEHTKSDGHSIYNILPYITYQEAMDFATYFDHEKVNAAVGAIISYNFDKIRQFNNKRVILAILNADTVNAGHDPPSYSTYSTFPIGHKYHHFDNEYLNEFKLFKLIIAWIKTRHTDRKSHIEELLTRVRYGRMAYIGQLEAISKHPFIAASPKLSQIVGLTVAEIYLNKEKRPSADALKRYQDDTADREPLAHVFRKRSLSENTQFATWNTKYSFNTTIK